MPSGSGLIDKLYMGRNIQELSVGDTLTLHHVWLVQVQEPPTWLEEPQDVRGVEGGAILMGCRAEGSPMPYYTWLDANGNDVTRKSGIKSVLTL
jgi:hypothetical protein